MVFKNLSKRARKLLFLLLLAIIVAVGATLPNQAPPADNDTNNLAKVSNSPAGEALKKLPIKGRSPKTGYSRAQFGGDWQTINGCDTRERILARDLKNITYQKTTQAVVCIVLSGVLNDPYTGKIINFSRGPETSSQIQIDHVVALSDAWQKGAQALNYKTRLSLANDPLELLAVDGSANQQKSDGDAATWLPSNKNFRCSYIARQIAVKIKYNLWITRPEYDAMAKILNACPNQKLPS